MPTPEELQAEFERRRRAGETSAEKNLRLQREFEERRRRTYPTVPDVRGPRVPTIRTPHYAPKPIEPVRREPTREPTTYRGTTFYGAPARREPTVPPMTGLDPRAGALMMGGVPRPTTTVKRGTSLYGALPSGTEQAIYNPLLQARYAFSLGMSPSARAEIERELTPLGWEMMGGEPVPTGRVPFPPALPAIISPYIYQALTQGGIAGEPVYEKVPEEAISDLYTEIDGYWFRDVWEEPPPLPSGAGGYGGYYRRAGYGRGGYGDGGYRDSLGLVFWRVAG